MFSSTQCNCLHFHARKQILQNVVKFFKEFLMFYGMSTIFKRIILGSQYSGAGSLLSKKKTEEAQPEGTNRMSDNN